MIKFGPGRPLVVPLRAGVGLAVAVPALTWWAIGPLGRQMPDHEYGPYHVPLALERVAGVAAILIAVAAVAGIVVSTRGRTPRHSMAAGTTLCLVAAGAFGAAGWRAETAGVVGANIGGGLVLLAGPMVIAGLLVAAVRIERQARGTTMAHSTLLTWLAALAAPVLLAVQFGLSWYDQSIGVISAGEYATVQVGDQHSGVRDRLGRPGDPVDWFFTPAPTGATCEYYHHGITRWTVYQLCYRDGVLVSKKQE